MPNLPTDNLYKFLAIGGIVLIGIGFLAPEPYIDKAMPTLLAQIDEASEAGFVDRITPPAVRKLAIEGDSLHALFIHLGTSADSALAALNSAIAESDAFTNRPLPVDTPEAAFTEEVNRMLANMARRHEVVDSLVRTRESVVVKLRSVDSTLDLLYEESVVRTLMPDDATTVGDMVEHIMDLDIKSIPLPFTPEEVLVTNKVIIPIALARKVERIRRIGYVLMAIGFLASVLGFALWYLRVQRYQDEMVVMQRDQARVELWRKQRDLL